MGLKTLVGDLGWTIERKNWLAILGWIFWTEILLETLVRTSTRKLGDSITKIGDEVRESTPFPFPFVLKRFADDNRFRLAFVFFSILFRCLGRY